MELLIFLALLGFALFIGAVGIYSGNLGMGLLAAFFFILLGIIVISPGVDYTTGTTHLEWGGSENISGNVTNVTYTNVTDVKTTFSGSWANTYGLAILLAGVMLLLITATAGLESE